MNLMGLWHMFLNLFQTSRGDSPITPRIVLYIPLLNYEYIMYVFSMLIIDPCVTLNKILMFLENLIVLGNEDMTMPFKQNISQVDFYLKECPFMFCMSSKSSSEINRLRFRKRKRKRTQNIRD